MLRPTKGSAIYRYLLNLGCNKSYVFLCQSQLDECKSTQTWANIQAFIHYLTEKKRKKLVSCWFLATYSVFLIFRAYKYQRKLPKNLCYKKVIIIFALEKEVSETDYVRNFVV